MKLFKPILLNTFLIVLCFSGLKAQNAKLSLDGKQLVADLKKQQLWGEENLRSKQNEIPKTLIEQYQIIRLDRTYHIGILALVEKNKALTQELRQLGVKIGTDLGDLITLRCPLYALEELQKVEGIRYLEIGGDFSPDLNRSHFDTRVDSIHAGAADLPRPFRGKNVVIGIIDWGFDYGHPVFFDEDGEELRIKRAWDQNKTGGPAPEKFGFGTEYRDENGILAAQHDTEYVFGMGSHGTHVMGIAGGSGGGTEYVGVAPEADLVSISLLRDAPSLIDAFQYVKDYATEVGKPFVINMSFGSHLGPHDGTDLKNQGIDAMVNTGRIFVGSAGNNGNTPFHIYKDFNGAEDTMKTFVRFNNIADSYGQTLSIWGGEGDDLEVSLKVFDNNAQFLGKSPTFLSATEPHADSFFVVDNDTVFFRMQSEASSILNGKPNIRWEVRNPSRLHLALNINSPNGGEVHIWNNVRMNNRYTNWGVPMVNNIGGNVFPDYETADTEYGPGEPGGVGKSVITVAAHQTDRFINEQLLTGGLANFSSQGPTVDGRVKPDISAPGQSIASAISSYDEDPGTDVFNPIEKNGRTYVFKRQGGTSMSGPTIAGIVALMLEANPELSQAQVKEIIMNTARQDDRTGEIPPEGHLRWGAGKVDALSAVQQALVTQDLDKEKTQYNQSIQVYPNPSKDGHFRLVFEEVLTNNVQLQVFDLNGKSVYEERLDLTHPLVEHPLALSHLPKGLYVVRAVGRDFNSIQKIIIQ